MSNILRGLTESSFADQFMATMKNKGINARLAGTPDQERERTEKELAQRAQAHANQPKPTLSPEEVEQLKAQLAKAKEGFDKDYEYSDDYTFWSQQNQKSQTIRDIEKQLRDAGVELNEISMDTLARYKKAAGADARAADKEGDFKRGDKRFSGIIRATKKEFNKAAKETPKTEGKFTVNAKTGAKLDPKTGEPLPAPVKAPAAPKKPKLTYDMVWRKVEDVVSQIFPDGDPIDYMIPWFKQHGITDFKVGEIIDKAAKKNGYKDMYDYWDSMKREYGDQGVAEGLSKQARAKKEAESVKAAIARLEQELKDPNPHIDKDDIRRRLETEKRRLELYRDVLDEQGVAEGSEEKDPVWNKGTPMPKDYTCHCGLYVHPSRRNPKAIHTSDCPYAKKQDKEQGVAEGYSLKKTGVSKYMEPGDPDEWTQDVNIKDTDYKIINNKTGQVVGTASWTTNDFFGPGALKITMKNGATRWLDIWEREKGNPQTAFNRFVKDPKTAKKYKEQGVAEGLVGDVVVHNYTKMPIDLKPGQVQIHGWGPSDQPIYRVKGADGKEVITGNKKKMMMIARGQGVAEGYEETEETAVINMFEKLVKQGRDPIDMIAHKFGWGSYELDQLAQNLGFNNSAEWASAATQGKGVTESDISGLLAASHLNRSFIITANLAEGGTKKFRVKAQSERVAVEKFKKHHSMAEIVDVKEETVKEDWQKVNKSDKTDGMSDKAVKAYRRENPGSKLKTAVTKDPSKIKKGSSDDKRRKSFCARMSGMKKAHASAKTKRDPDSPINKALRRWNCEESVEESLRTENPCWKGYEPVGTKKKNGKTVPNCVPVKKESSIMKGIVDENK